jgi:serine/threonine protein phosphatase PrpC
VSYVLIIIAYSIKDKLGGDSNCGLFAVFDGHGGKQVADHC